MAKIRPFKAVRPTRDKAHLVVSKSYEYYTEVERTVQMQYNPYSFLHIVNPGYKYDKNITGEQRYKLVRNRYFEFKEEAILQQDTEPCYYVYKIVDPMQEVFSGIIAIASTQEYATDVIKKHENTLQERENTFKEYLKTVGFNAEPVLLTYPDHDTITTLTDRITSQRAEYEFTTPYKDTHYLWKVSDATTIEQLAAAFDTIPTLYIADGHHRSASSYLLAQEMMDTTDNNYQFFLSYLIPESKLRIYEFNRLVKDLNGLSKEEFLIQLDTWFRIKNKGNEVYKPSKPHHFSMYLDGTFYALYLRKNMYEFTDALSELDTQILFKTVLAPILGIQNPRTDTRLEYAHGKHDSLYIKNKVDQGAIAVGFGLFPATATQITKIADQGLKMPPKSTYIEPKLYSGMSIYEF